MDDSKKQFGVFINEKRLADDRELTLRDVSEELGISLTLLSDIEKGRRKPFDNEKIEKFCDYLNLTVEDKTKMYDLAAQYTEDLPYDIEDTIMNSEAGELARVALRLTNQGKASKEDWRDFIDRLEKNKGG